MNSSQVSDVRLTMATVLVLEKLLAGDRKEPLWGLEICRSADLGPSTVYPILARLREREWVSVRDEGEGHPSRPARRFYRLTDAGRQKAMTALAERRARLDRNGIQ